MVLIFVESSRGSRKDDISPKYTMFGRLVHKSHTPEIGCILSEQNKCVWFATITFIGWLLDLFTK